MKDRQYGRTRQNMFLAPVARTDHIQLLNPHPHPPYARKYFGRGELGGPQEGSWIPRRPQTKKHLRESLSRSPPEPGYEM
jgi:hypothetical protein